MSKEDVILLLPELGFKIKDNEFNNRYTHQQTKANFLLFANSVRYSNYQKTWFDIDYTLLTKDMLIRLIETSNEQIKQNN